MALELAGGSGAAVRRGAVRRRLRGPVVARAGANGDRPSPAGANPGAHAVAHAYAIPHSPSDGNRNTVAYTNTYADAGADGDSHAAPNADFHARADADRHASAARPPGAYWRCRLCR